MQTYRIALFGHRELSSYRKVEMRLERVLREALQRRGSIEVYIGRNGEFDELAASVVKRLSRAVGAECCEMTLILPYFSGKIEYYERYYDRVLIPEEVWRLHPKRAIEARNRFMVEQSDLCVCYVEKPSGGAAKALAYAKALGKETVNLSLNEPD